LAGLFEQFFDEARGFELVEGFDALAEAFLGEGFDVVLVEVLFAGDLEDEVALFGRALPGVLGGTNPATVAVAIAGSGFGWGYALGQETGLLDLAVHTALHEAVKFLLLAETCDTSLISARRVRLYWWDE
jgi:hypothetical protein